MKVCFSLNIQRRGPENRRVQPRPGQAGERFQFRLGTQVTNILNHPNWSNLSSGALRLDNSSGRAKITGADGATPGSAGDAAGPRVMRLDLRIDF
ncbi:MAG: hypothetical protein HY238_20215 [Acidobacteria bacterium]|nr:hypothetical protein [Acidobacteriota bacterium]